MPPQHRFGFHNKKRIAPTSEPSTGANPELSIGIAQARLRAPAVQHEQLLPQAQILGNQQGLRLESGRNDPDEKANHPLYLSQCGPNRALVSLTDRADSPGATYCPLCPDLFGEHLGGGTSAPAGCRELRPSRKTAPGAPVQGKAEIAAVRN